jgi:hypothetical protein
VATRSNDTAPPPAPRSGPARAAVVVVLFAAVLQLIGTQLNQAAPARRDFASGTPIAIQARRQMAFTAPIVRLADGRNVELSFDEPSPPPAGAAVVTAGVYYGVNYALCPARAFVGDDRAIINDGASLRAADHLPADGWLREHGVAAVLTYPVDERGMYQPQVRLIR